MTTNFLNETVTCDIETKVDEALAHESDMFRRGYKARLQYRDVLEFCGQEGRDWLSDDAAEWTDGWYRAESDIEEAL